MPKTRLCWFVLAVVFVGCGDDTPSASPVTVPGLEGGVDAGPSPEAAPPVDSPPSISPPALPAVVLADLYPGPAVGETYVVPKSATQGGMDVLPLLTDAAAGVTSLDTKPVTIDFGREVGGFVELKGGDAVTLKFAERKAYAAAGDYFGFVPQTSAPSGFGMTLAGTDWVSAVPLRGGFRWLTISGTATALLKGVRVKYTPRIIDVATLPGSFNSTDPVLNRSYYVGLHTLALCSINPAQGDTDGNVALNLNADPWVIVDGAKRDRMVWNGDLKIAAEVVWTTLGNDPAVKSSLTTNSDKQLASGLIPAVTPANAKWAFVGTFFPEYVGWWVIAWADQIINQGDIPFGMDTWDKASAAMAYLATLTDSRGLLSGKLTWAVGLDRSGVTSYQNMIYLSTLRQYRRAAAILNKDPGPDTTAALAAAIRAAFWDDTRKVFIEREMDPHVPQDANSHALLLGLVADADAKANLKFIQDNHWSPYGSTNLDIPYDDSQLRQLQGTAYTTPVHNKRVFPFIGYFEVLARLRAGDGAGALELIRRTWGNMLKRSTQTSFWEVVGPDGDAELPGISLAHAWSAGVTPLLGKEAVGYRREDDGTIVLRPSNLPLERYRTRLPTTAPITADVTYTPAFQQLDVSEGPAMMVEVSDQPNQKVWMGTTKIVKGDPNVVSKPGVLRIGPLTPPFTIDFVPRTAL